MSEMKGFYIQFVCTQFTEICQVILRHSFVRSPSTNNFQIWIWRHAWLMCMKYTSRQNEKKWKRKDIFVYTNRWSLLENFVDVWAIGIFHRLVLEIEIILSSYKAFDDFCSSLFERLGLRSMENSYLHEWLEKSWRRECWKKYHFIKVMVGKSNVDGRSFILVPFHSFPQIFLWQWWDEYSKKNSKVQT